MVEKSESPIKEEQKTPPKAPEVSRLSEAPSRASEAGINLNAPATPGATTSGGTTPRTSTAQDSARASARRSAKT